MVLLRRNLKNSDEYHGRAFFVDAWWSSCQLWVIWPSLTIEFYKNWTVNFYWLKFVFRFGIDEWRINR